MDSPPESIINNLNSVITVNLFEDIIQEAGQRILLLYESSDK